MFSLLCGRPAALAPSTDPTNCASTIPEPPNAYEWDDVSWHKRKMWLKYLPFANNVCDHVNMMPAHLWVSERDLPHEVF